MTIIFEMVIKKRVKYFRLFHFTKVLTEPSLKGWVKLSNILHATIKFRSDEVQSISLSLVMANCLPFTDDVMVVLVHKCVQQTHLLALHLILQF